MCTASTARLHRDRHSVSRARWRSGAGRPDTVYARETRASIVTADSPLSDAAKKGATTTAQGRFRVPRVKATRVEFARNGREAFDQRSSKSDDTGRCARSPVRRRDRTRLRALLAVLRTFATPSPPPCQARPRLAVLTVLVKFEDGNKRSRDLWRFARIPSFRHPGSAKSTPRTTEAEKTLAIYRMIAARSSRHARRGV